VSRRVLGHVAAGVALGAMLAPLLLVGDGRHLFEIVGNGANSKVTMIVLLGLFASIFAIGAGLSGRSSF